MTKGIIEISRQGIQTIPTCGQNIHGANELRDALLEINATPGVIQAGHVGEAVFKTLTGQQHTRDTLNKFLFNWQATHITSPYVAGLMIRITQAEHEARRIGETAKAELLSCASYHVGQIIKEDMGLDGILHSEFYERFADAVSGGDDWKSKKYGIPETAEFRRYVEKGRLRESVEDAILLTAASENWNTGEYTFADPLINKWMHEDLGLTRPQAIRASAYVRIHSGDTELDHFTHAIKAWQLWCEAHGQEAKPERAAHHFAEYTKRVGQAFEGLQNILTVKPLQHTPAISAPALVIT